MQVAALLGMHSSTLEALDITFDNCLPANVPHQQAVQQGAALLGSLTRLHRLSLAGPGSSQTNDVQRLNALGGVAGQIHTWLRHRQPALAVSTRTFDRGCAGCRPYQIADHAAPAVEQTATHHPAAPLVGQGSQSAGMLPMPQGAAGWPPAAVPAGAAAVQPPPQGWAPAAWMPQAAPPQFAQHVQPPPPQPPLGLPHPMAAAPIGVMANQAAPPQFAQHVQQVQEDSNESNVTGAFPVDEHPGENRSHHTTLYVGFLRVCRALRLDKCCMCCRRQPQAQERYRPGGAQG